MGTDCGSLAARAEVLLADFDPNPNRALWVEGELNQALVLSPIFRTESTPAQDEDHRVSPLELGELSMRSVLAGVARRANGL